MTASAADQVRVAIQVAVAPAVAFRVFTAELDAWWRRGLAYRVAPGDRGVISLEPRVGGRLFESYRVDGVERVVETGTVTAWQPPTRLVFEGRAVNFVPGQRTEVEVTFAPSGRGTLVTVTHRGWDAIPSDHPVRHGRDSAAFLRELGRWWGELARGLAAHPQVRAATIEELVADLAALGVRPGGVLLVHTSFRAVGPVVGGPLGLIAALRTAVGPTGTVVMPTMTDGLGVFDPRTTPTVDMGVTAELFWRQPGVLRSGHPGGSFAAAGPHAAAICAPQPLSPPHGVDSPVGRVHDQGGQILLLGVGHGENTTLHLAEAVAAVPYAVEHPCLVVGDDGVARTIAIAETDHCCQRFALADGWLRARDLQREGRVGRAHARLVDARAVVEVAVAALAAEPLIFLCPPAEACAECDRARASVVTPITRELS